MQIFVTGAAGLIGGELCAQLARAGHAVVGLVRQNSDIRSNDGSILHSVALETAMPAPATLATVRGDVRLSGLGLDDGQRALLQKSVDLVVHCAAITAFDADPAEYQAVNVAGTGHLLAAFPQARFIHVSTAYVCGLKNGAISEAERDDGFGFANGYEASKAAAEALVRQSGVPHVIARPSIVVGDSRTGVIRDFDTIYATFRLIAEGRITVLPASDNAHLDFVPIDHVIGGLCDLVEHRFAAPSATVHLASGTPVPIASFVGAIGSFGHLRQPVIERPELFDAARLPRLEQRLYRRTASLYASYFQRDPRFETAVLRNLTGRACPAVDLPMLQRMIGHCIDRGFIANAASVPEMAQ